MLDTRPFIEATDFPPVRRGMLEILQANLGYRCNQSCLHCHVNAGPNRKEVMSDELVALIVPATKARGINTLDLTGGAPEMHPKFRCLVTEARAAGLHVIDRCNLTVLFEPDQAGLAEFLAEQQVEVVASMPCYALENVDQQRGKGVFDKSIEALRKLNTLGYGVEGSGLQLNLVFNPQGPSLPPDQSTLQAAYRRELGDKFGIVFNALYTLANMPIKRFGSTLLAKHAFEPYMALLRQSYRAENLAQVMCRSLVSVDWQGYLYDCDFNQQLELPLAGEGRAHLRDLLQTDIAGQDIRIADHCWGCTAGQGSSCGGAL